MCRLRFPNNLVAYLQMPEKGVTTNALSLPHPCNIVHTLMVETYPLQPMGFSVTVWKASFSGLIAVTNACIDSGP